MTCNHEPFNIEVETQNEFMTMLSAECEKCGSRLWLNVAHNAWSTRDSGPQEPWEEQVDHIDSLLEDLDDLPSAADDFADKARSFLTGVRRWAKEHKHITDAQIEGIERWEGGLEKWRR